MCLCVLTDNNREYIETRMSSEEFIMSKIVEERKKWKKEWTDMPKAVGQDGELIPSWETFKRKKLKREWESLQEPKPSWEACKRMTSKKRNTFK